MSDLVPQAVRDLLAFYTERCPDVRFADLDIEVLKHAVESIDAAAKALTVAEQAAEQARERFQNSEAELSGKARRTLSFLKIHVEGDEEQLATLESIGAAMPGSRRKSKAGADGASSTVEPRRRGSRKSKQSSETSSGPLPNPSRAIDAALEKVLLSDEAPSDPGSDEPSVTPKPENMKTDSKSSAGR